jgi:DNA-directed RNA polymerase specialized sigma24 family protein
MNRAREDFRKRAERLGARIPDSVARKIQELYDCDNLSAKEIAKRFGVSSRAATFAIHRVLPEAL